MVAVALQIVDENRFKSGQP